MIIYVTKDLKHGGSTTDGQPRRVLSGPLRCVFPMIVLVSWLFPGPHRPSVVGGAAGDYFCLFPTLDGPRSFQSLPWVVSIFSGPSLVLGRCRRCPLVISFFPDPRLVVMLAFLELCFLSVLSFCTSSLQILNLRNVRETDT